MGDSSCSAFFTAGSNGRAGVLGRRFKKGGMTLDARRLVAMVVLTSFLAGCATGPGMRPLPPVPTDAAVKLRERIEALRSEKVELPPLEKPGPPPAEISCEKFESDPTLFLCQGDPAKMKPGPGIFFAYDGPAQELAKRIASEKLLREMAQIIKTRMDLRDQMLLAVLDALEMSLFMAEEYRQIAVIRGDEVDRLRHEKLIDRLTMMIPIIGLAAGVFFLGIK